MDSQKSLQARQQAVEGSAQILSDAKAFGGFNVDLIIFVMIVVSFLPAFLDPGFYQPVSRFVVLVLLGCGYGLTAYFLTRWHERHLTWWSGLVYFGIQTTIIFFLLALSQGINQNFWLLMLPLVGQGFSLGMWRGAIGIALLQLATFSGYVVYLNRANLSSALVEDVFSVLISLASAMFFVMIFTYLALREGLARQEISALATDLRDANQRLAAYAEQVDELATMRERNRLAREIHDNLGHYLTVVNVQIEAARAVMHKDAERAEGALTKAQRLTQEGLASVRQSVSALREAPWEGRPLSNAIGELIEQSRATGLPVSYVVNGSERPLPPQIAHTLYRTVQEGLTNIRKYAAATLVTVSLDYSAVGPVMVQIKDNGRGSDKIEGGFGLLGLRERVSLLDGTLMTKSQPNQGFELTVQLPVEDV